MKKLVYSFEEGSVKMKDLLGNKGAQLAEMTRIGLPVPPGFTITTEACKEFYTVGENLLKRLEVEVLEKLKMVENKVGKKFGDPNDPLLFSVRSGAAISMPGMMDTVLNLGLSDQTVKGLIKQTADERFAYDCYRRFVQMFGDVVLCIKGDKFEKVLEKYKQKLRVKTDAELPAKALKEMVKEYKRIVKKESGKEFPADPFVQLKLAIKAVFNSWNNPRAVTYRRANKLPQDLGTGVNIQSMVFGNAGNDSGTGVAFTRNPSTGEKKLFAEYLLNAQGEDVVAGVRTPKEISEMKKELPEAYKDLVKVCRLLEKHYKDVQDIEFTIEKGKLYMLQTRTGKRTAQAAVKIAVDMFKEGLISKEEAIIRIEPNQLEQLLHKRIDTKAKLQIIAKGLAASPGAAVGKVVFNAKDAVELAERGEKVILVRNETSPEDIGGMIAAQGVLTARGGLTSHAAIVSRGMGKCCVAGCEAIEVNEKAKKFTVNGTEIKEGDWVSLDGGVGNVILGKAPTIEPTMTGEFKELTDLADKIRTLGVKANADTPKDAKIARDFGAEGIGLCRTEHMFFGKERLPWVQHMILATDKRVRKKALDKLLPMQKQDFKGIFKAMEGLPVIIRLLDPPLHEFLPNYADLLVKLTRLKGERVSPAKIKKLEGLLHSIEALKEMNPMLGHRGCRLGVTFPEVYEMQARAILEAACELKKEGYKVLPEIMIPVVSEVNEIKILREIIERVARESVEKYKVKVKCKIGTMIELPRACLTADEIAKEAEFFSFGTNDLTQTTFGFSRDDVEGKFLSYYIEHNILPADPFVSIDQSGVGELVKIGTERGRKTNPDLEVGICGEHGGEPQSVEFCHRVGLDYVSCSPFRVPVARLAAAQAQIKFPHKRKAFK